jgi:hypothetical protein
MSIMEWYYTKGQESQGPVDISVLKSLLAEGKLPEGTLVWNPSMGDKWAKPSEVPELSTPAAPQPAAPAQPPAPAPAPARPAAQPKSKPVQKQAAAAAAAAPATADPAAAPPAKPGGYACPRCGGSVQRATSNTAGVAAGLVGMLFYAAFGSFQCQKCGQIPRSEFPPEMQAKMMRGSIILVVVALALSAFVIWLIVTLNK